MDGRADGTVGLRHAPAQAPALIVLVALLVTSVFLPGAVAQEPEYLEDVDAGREMSANNCAACHGAAAEGRGAAPP